jgi:small ligand-binding sensory domain FIST
MMSIDILVKGSNESHHFHLEEMADLEEVLALMVEALKVDYPQVVGLGAEVSGGRVIWDDPFGY